MRIAVAAAVLVVLTSVAAAQAPGQTMSFDPTNPPSAQEPQTITVSYRRDVMMADGLALALVFAAPVSESEELAGWGVTTYFLGAPLVHVAHGRGVAALQSLGLRAGLPLAGALIGYRLGPDDMVCDYGASPNNGDFNPDRGTCPDGGSIIGMVLGGVAGGITAVALDWKYLTKYEKQVPWPSWSASIKPTHGGATVGVSGAF
ncbi:MAG TPA: hypothetical protein VL326_20310 [Kofleriaceae bacterium]|nr:hypothetical protein [Kofleriaceae bacterium]